MIFWLGLLIALLSGIPQINFFRNAFKRRCKWVNEHRLDYIALAFLISGLFVSASDHILAERQAEKERLARIRIEQQLEPRSLNENQQQKIADKIRRFSPQPFELIIYPEDKEVIGLSKMIAKPLRLAGWTEVKSTSWLAFGLITGVRIEYPKKKKLLEDSALALAAALLEEGISASASVYKNNTKNNYIIRIKVGKKP